MFGRRRYFYISPESIAQYFIFLMKLCVIVFPITLFAMVYRDHNILAAVSLGFFVLAIISYLSDRKFSRSYLFYTFLLSLLVGIATMFIFFSNHF